MFSKSSKHFFPHGVPFQAEDLPPWDLLNKMHQGFQHYQEKGLYQIRISLPSGTIVENPESVFIDEGVIVEPGAFIRGPCVLKRGVEVRFGAYIRGFVWMEEGSVLGHACEVKNVFIGKNSHLAHFVYAGDSVIGSNVNLASHVTLANLRLDRAPVQPMGKIKFGAIIGDGAQIGCHVVINPGKQIAPFTKMYATQSLVVEE